VDLGSLALWQVILYVALFAYWVVVAIVVITDDRGPTVTLAWLLVLFSFPITGLIFYYLFGRNWKKQLLKDPWLPQIIALARPVMIPLRERYSATNDLALERADEQGYGSIIRIIHRTETTPVMPAYDVELLVNGEKKFAALKKDLAAAKDTIDIQYFIWEHDELTAELTEILLDRLAAGVEVRMLNDWAGNLAYKKDEIKRMREAGAQIHADITDLRKINYRDHRKIVVIDGVLGYTGGINVGQEYIDGAPHYPAWRDTHVRFHGPAVAELQKLFAIRWHSTTKENLFTERFFPAEYPENGRMTPTQIVSTGVDQLWDPARRAHLIGIGAAKERVWIQSPYLVPTEDIYSAMMDAALSGHDVRFMMTGWPDKKIAYYAAESFFSQLVDAGVKVYRYNKGFLHAKTMTIDGKIAVIGTMNFDIRSLALHQELMAWFFDEELAAQHEAVFLADMEECELVTREVLDSWTATHRLRNATARLTSNLL
jgi:cardiolipin synthase A/B